MWSNTKATNLYPSNTVCRKTVYIHSLVGVLFQVQFSFDIFPKQVPHFFVVNLQKGSLY